MKSVIGMKNLRLLAAAGMTMAVVGTSFAHGNHNPYEEWELVNKGTLVVNAMEDLDKPGSGKEDISYPSIVAVPNWVENKADPSAKYYMYYGEHHGIEICMKWAPAIEGPWTEFNVSRNSVGVMDFLADSYRNGGKEDWVRKGHIAAPDVMIDYENRVFIMAFHGDTEGGKMKLSTGETYVFRHTNFLAFSKDGLNFNDPETGGGQSGMWGPSGYRLPYGPLEQHFKNTDRGDISVTTKVTEGYARFIKIHNKLYCFSSRGSLSRPKNPNSPWHFPAGEYESDEWLWEDEADEKGDGDPLWNSGDPEIEWYKRELGNDFKYRSHIATFFASSRFGNHPNNPSPGDTVSTGSDSPKVNHIAVYPVDQNTIEAFIYIRKDDKQHYDVDDPFRDVMRIELDVSDSDWHKWGVKKHNGMEILDVILQPSEVRNRVEAANGGGRVDPYKYADPMSMGVPGIIVTPEGKYCFIGFKSQQLQPDSSHSEGQIMAIRLDGDGGSVAEDTTPPTPNPSRWSVQPYAISDSAVSMTAATASDPSGGVRYRFHNVTTETYASWQSSPSYTWLGLMPGRNYTFRVKTRDALGNEGSYSEGVMVTLKQEITEPPVINSMVLNPSSLTESYSTASVTVHITDPDQDVDQVKLYLNGQLVGTKSGSNGATTSSYLWHSNRNPMLLGLPVGSHRLVATVVDDQGQTSSANATLNVVADQLIEGGKITTVFSSPVNARLSGISDIVLNYSISSTGTIRLDASTSDSQADSTVVEVLNGWAGIVGQVEDPALFGASFTLKGTARSRNSSTGEVVRKDLRIDGRYDGGVLGVTGQNSSRIDGYGSSAGPTPETMRWSLSGSNIQVEFIGLSLANIHEDGAMRISDSDTTRLISPLGTTKEFSLAGQGYVISDGEAIRFLAETGVNSGAGLSAFTFLVSAVGTRSFDLLEGLPQNYMPEAIGNAAANELANRSATDFYRSSTDNTLHYAELYSAYAACRFARASGNQSLVQRYIGRYNALLNDNSDLIRQDRFGYYKTAIVLLEWYKARGNSSYLDLAFDRAEGHWRKWDDVTSPDVFGSSTFSDAMFANPVIEASFYHVASGDASFQARCADYAIRWINAHIDNLQQENGLIFQKVNANGAEIVWGRGCGWGAVGMTEALSIAPENHPLREKVMQAYLQLMDALLNYQSDDGLWYQVVDLPAHPNNWQETSGTAMFAYSMIVGVKKGWLNANIYGPAAQKAWLALANRVNSDGQLEDVCKGLNAQDDVNAYLDKSRWSRTGDYHGQAPLLMCAAALLE